MGSSSSYELYDPTTPPKLSIFSFPSNRDYDNINMLTPPVHTSASIPFQWEEAPGKPKPSRHSNNNNTIPCQKPIAARSLELPPRLSNITNMPSPTTVLDGPDRHNINKVVPRRPSTLSNSLSFRKMGGGSFRVLPENNNNKSSGFGSSRWGNVKKQEDGSRVSFDFSMFPAGDIDDTRSDSGVGDGENVKIVKMRRRRRLSLFRFSTTKSHVMANLYESIKQVVVPWRRR
ncbi:hypothetical protein ACFE04_011018 [Oxalis oulophora]